jgi:hypothetical protein
MNFSATSSFFFRGQLQWQPVLVGHDPNPPIPLEGIFRGFTEAYTQLGLSAAPQMRYGAFVRPVDTLVDVPVGALSLGGLTPTVVATANQFIDVPAGALVLAGLVPTVVASDHKTIAVPVGLLSLDGYAPTVLTGGGVIVDVPVGLLSLVGHAPTVLTGAEPVSGGFWGHYEVHRRRRERERDDEDEREAESQRIADAVTRQIALEFRASERAAAKRAEFERLAALVRDYGQVDLGSTAAQRALDAARRAATQAHLERLARELARLAEEEEFAVLMALAID